MTEPELREIARSQKPDTNGLLMEAILNLILKKPLEIREKIADLHLKRTALAEGQKIDYSLIKRIKNDKSGSKENSWSITLDQESNGGALDQNEKMEENTTTLLLLSQDFYSIIKSS